MPGCESDESFTGVHLTSVTDGRGLRTHRGAPGGTSALPSLRPGSSSGVLTGTFNVQRLSVQPSVWAASETTSSRTRTP
jgi:hypothetical protein